jgi:hypothetical protein
MKQTESSESAAGSAKRVIVEENPYLQGVASEEQTSRTAGGNGSAETDDEEAAALAEMAAEKTKRKQRRHRRFALAFIAAFLSASVVTAVVIYRQRSTRIEYGRANQPRVLPPPPNAGTTTGRDNRTEQALRQMQQLTGEDRSAGNAKAEATSTRDATRNSSDSNLASDSVDSQHPFDLPNTSDSTQTSTTSGESSPRVSGTTNEQPSRSQRNTETSIYVGERTDDRTPPALLNAERTSGSPNPIRESHSEPKVVLPPFGSMLPVRTIGGLYTLRSGALARLELTPRYGRTRLVHEARNDTRRHD